MYNSVFYLSLIAFFISIGSGVYFTVRWFVSGKKYTFLLYFAYGLGAQLLFKIPSILANGGAKFDQHDFYLFFYITLLAYFLAYFSLIKGLSYFENPVQNKFALGVPFFVLFSIAVVYFALSFFVNNSYAPVWAGHIIFYLPAEFLLLHKLQQLHKQPQKSEADLKIGVKWSIFGTFLLMITSIFYIYTQVYPYPQQFWYVSVISSPTISLLQIASGSSLFIGFYFLTRFLLKRLRNSTDSFV